MKKALLLLIAVLFFANSFSQSSFWTKTNRNQVTSELLARDSHPNEFLVYSLNLEMLKAKLALAPSRNFNGQESNVIVDFPNPQGEMQHYRIYEASVLHPELAERHPEIQSYVGKGIEDKTATIRFSITLFGLHTMTFSGVNGTSYIDTYTKDLKNYMVYSRSQLTATRGFYCGVVDNANELDPALPDNPEVFRANNSLFKTYRLALACTIEYAAFHVNAAGAGGGTLAQKKAAVLAAMVVTMTRVNGVYERDMSLTMQMVPNEESIINITSDSYDDSNTNNILLSQNQTQVDAIIGSANYDIGHVCSTGGGGVASLGCVCTSIKAQGVTGSPAPVGDPYDIDYVAHEMGHQFGGSHTFNSVQGACSGNRSTTSAFEPGSGTTIMAYAGICSPEDVQLHSDAYFHARTLIQMIALVNGTANCAVAVSNNNTPPVVSAGGNYTIPFGTAFALTGSATDVDNDALTYCWEQYNFSSSTVVATPTTTSGPNFRSLNPTASPKRYFPVFSSVLANNLAPTWEVVPSVARVLTFSLVARDNRSPLGGQTERSTMTLTIANTGPFKVTSQSTATAWAQNSTQTITWDVAGTDANNINTSLVNIKLSTDGGATFPYVLAENTPNDGNETITAPDLVSQNCRIMIEAVGNVFYAVNSKPFYIGYQIINSCATYNYTTPFNLTDGSNSYTVKTINVPLTGNISDTNITINATHPNLQNLVMAVIRPGGNVSTIFNQQCTGSANMNVTFDAQGAALTCASPTTGSYVPPTGFNLDTFNNNNQLGNWQFGFKDVVAGDTGTINSIGLEICSIVYLLLDTNTFGFENFALYPNPNNGKFTVQFDSGTNSKIGITVHDLRGRKIYDQTYSNSGLFNQELQLKDAQAGVYLVSITNGDKKMVKRMVIN